MLTRIPNFIGIYFCCAAIGMTAVNTRAADSLPTAGTENLACPQTPEQWAATIKRSLLERSSPYELKKTDDLLIELQRRCQPKSDAAATIDECMKPVRKLLPTLGSYDVGIREKGPRTMDPLVLPQPYEDHELRKAVNSADTPLSLLEAQIKKLMSQLPAGTKCMHFMSGVIGLRTLVTYLPGENEDTFVHSNTEEGMSYLVIRSIKKINGKPLPQPIMDYFMTGEDNPRVGTPMTERCVSCHRAGTIAILPQPGTLRSCTPGMSDSEIMPWFEKVRPKFADQSNYDMSRLGPPMGPDDPTYRTQEWVQDCAKKVKPDVTQEEAAIIRTQMNCVSCHITDGPGVDLLRFPMQAILRQSPFNYTDNVILKGYMPEHPVTPENLREPLLSCLKQEYFGGFLDSRFSQGDSKPGILMRSLLKSNCPYPKKN